MTEALNVSMNDELEKAIKAATDPVALRSAILAEAERQQAAVLQKTADDAANAAAAATAAATAAAATEAARSHFRTENIGGRDFEFTADSEAELDQMILNAYRIAYSVREDAAATETVIVDPAAEARAAEVAAAAEAVAKAELEQKFKRGEISAADFIEQSGAVRDYLANQGVPIESLKATVKQAQNTEVTQSWEAASAAFLQSSAGANWPGGDQNKNLIGLKVAEMGLVDAQDKVAALSQAWAEMQRTGMVFATGAVDPAVQAAAAEAARVAAAAEATRVAASGGAGGGAAAIAAAETARAAAAIAAPKVASSSSALFGASSGVGAGAGSTERAVAPTLQIAKDASPAEILQAWKDQMMSQGKDPNAAFVDTFSSRRA